MHRMARKKYKLIFVLLLIVILFPLVMHIILLNTSYAYNEIFDKRAFNKMLEAIQPQNIERIGVFIRYPSKTSEEGKSGFTPLLISAEYREGLFSDISFHKSLWNDRDTGTITHSVTVFFKVRFIVFLTKDLNSGVFITEFDDRRFAVSIPSLKNFLEEYENQIGDYLKDRVTTKVQIKNGIIRILSKY